MSMVDTELDRRVLDLRAELQRIEPLIAKISDPTPELRLRAVLQGEVTQLTEAVETVSGWTATSELSRSVRRLAAMCSRCQRAWQRERAGSTTAGAPWPMPCCSRCRASMGLPG